MMCPAALSAVAARLVRKGYVDPLPVPSSNLVHDGVGWRRSATLAGTLEADVVMCLPTSLTRLDEDRVLAALTRLADQVSEGGEVLGVLGAVVSVIQCADEREFSLGLARAERIASEIGERIPVRVVVTTSSGKIPALNQAIALVSASSAAVGWVDDDVFLENGCLSALMRRFLHESSPLAVGACKVPSVTGHATSAAMARAKARMPSAMNYPHGCAMLVSREVLADGIPTRYRCDDGWVCFALIDPAHDDPLHRLVLEPAARVRYHVAGDLPSTVRRLRRQRLGQVLLAADAKPAVRDSYVRSSFLHGVQLWPWRPGSGPSPELALYSWIHVGTTLMLMLELALRGLLRRPLRGIAWGSPVRLKHGLNPALLEEAR